MGAGRPAMFKDADELEALVDKYFLHCVDQDEVPDVEGLAYFLDTTRKTLLDYENKKLQIEQAEEISYTIKKAKNRIFHHKKQAAFKGKMNPAVFIFDAKNNHEYVDKTEVDQNLKANIEHDIERMPDDELLQEIKRTTEAITALQKGIGAKD